MEEASRGVKSLLTRSCGRSPRVGSDRGREAHGRHAKARLAGALHQMFAELHAATSLSK